MTETDPIETVKCMDCASEVSVKKVVQWQDMNFCHVECLTNSFMQSRNCAKCCKSLKQNFIRMRLDPNRDIWLCSKTCVELMCRNLKMCDFCQMYKPKTGYGLKANPSFCSSNCSQAYNGYTAKANFVYCSICKVAKFMLRSSAVQIGQHIYHNFCWNKLKVDSRVKYCSTCKVQFYSELNRSIINEHGSTLEFCSETCKFFMMRMNTALAECEVCALESEERAMIKHYDGRIWCSLECARQLQPMRLLSYSSSSVSDEDAQSLESYVSPDREDNAKRGESILWEIASERFE